MKDVNYSGEHETIDSSHRILDAHLLVSLLQKATTGPIGLTHLRYAKTSQHTNFSLEAFLGGNCFTTRQICVAREWAHLTPRTEQVYSIVVHILNAVQTCIVRETRTTYHELLCSCATNLSVVAS
jgi:hypothetical protein